jgi:hypothetical protein
MYGLSMVNVCKLYGMGQNGRTVLRYGPYLIATPPISGIEHIWYIPSNCGMSEVLPTHVELSLTSLAILTSYLSYTISMAPNSFWEDYGE